MSQKPKIKDLDVSVLDRIIESETNAKSYADEQIALISNGKTIKHSYNDYILTATSDNQTDFEIPLATFDFINDKLTVVQRRTYLTKNDYTVVYEQGKNIIRLNEGVSSGTELYIVIDKNIVSEETGINGVNIDVGSLPIDRLSEDIETKIEADNRELAVREYIDSQIKSKESVQKIISNGTQIVNGEHDSLVRIIYAKGTTTINHAPLFDSGLWSLSTNSVISSPNLLAHTYTVGSPRNNSYYPILKDNTDYTFSVKHNGTIGVFYNNGSNTIVGYTENQSVTFNTSDRQGIMIVLRPKDEDGVYTFENVMLNEGKTVKTFVANIKGVTNPTIENKTTGQSLTLLGTFHEGDTINSDGTVTRKKREIILDGRHASSMISNPSGFKAVEITTDVNSIINGEMVKYNGKMMGIGYIANTADRFWFSGGNIRMWITNTDSGWGDSYNPSSDEIKAYFMGWKMFDNAVGITDTTTYTRTDGLNKRWGYKRDNGTWESSGTLDVVPTYSSREKITALYKEPYRLVHDLITPVTENVQTIGSISLHEGDNQIELSEGRIVRERIKFFDNTIGKYYVSNSTFSSEEFTKFKYQLNTILMVYENGKPFLNFRRRTDTVNKYGNERLEIDYQHFNPTAIYEVDYIPLEPYKITTEIDSLTIEYQSNLSSVVEGNMKNISELKSQVSVIDKDMVRKDAPVKWITPTLLNGWVGNTSVSMMSMYTKDDSGIVRLRGILQDGVKTANTILFYLPVGYRPATRSYFSTITYDGTSKQEMILQIHNNGEVSIRLFPSLQNIMLDGISFKAEQ